MAKAFLIAVLGLIGVCASLYAVLIGWLWWSQEKLLFIPEVLPASHRLVKEPGVHELTVPVPGATLSVLQLRLPNPKGVVYFLHGNAGSLDSWFDNTAFYRQANFDVVMLDYRGYGKSSGRITSQDQLRADVLAVWDHVAAQYRGKRLVVYGRSLGTALAAGLSEQLATQGRKPDLTVLVSPYASMRRMASEQYPWVPSFLLRYPLDTAGHLARVSNPIFMVHGGLDALIPVRHAEHLKQAVPSARLLVIPKADHNDIPGHAEYWEALRRELAQL